MGTTVVTGAARVVVVGGQSTLQPRADSCIRAGNHKF
jgi:hypothetical protein